MKLEYVDTLVLAHPFVKSFDRVNYCLDDAEQHAVCIGEVPAQMEGRTEKDLAGNEGKGGTYWTTTFYIGLQIERKPGESPLLLLLLAQSLLLRLNRRTLGKRMLRGPENSTSRILRTNSRSS
jgi:poly(A) polymerase Pap1